MNITQAFVLDFEATGTDVRTDRIVSLFAGKWSFIDQHFVAERHAIVNPGIPIPPESTEIHGITDDDARRRGADPFFELNNLALLIQEHCVKGGIPLIAFNAPYDLSLLRAEVERHRVIRADWDRILVIDPLVIDRELVPRRRGSGARKLGNLAPKYGIDVDETRLHDADYDSELAVRIADQQLRNPRLKARPLAEIHRLQEIWAAEQQAELEEFLGREISKGWPLYESHPVGEVAA